MSFMVIVRTLDKKKFIIQNSQFIIMITYFGCYERKILNITLAIRSNHNYELWRNGHLVG